LDTCKILKALSLYENQIVTIPVDTFVPLLNLEYLDIDNNRNVELEVNLLAHNLELLVFRASFNKIKSIPQGFFRSNDKLERIYLNNNNIVVVQVDFTILNDLYIVHLEGNKNGCDFSTIFFEQDDGKSQMEVYEEMVSFQHKVKKFCWTENGNQ
jgi:Leucine-rich repeat (LRR) protein